MNYKLLPFLIFGVTFIVFGNISKKSYCLFDNNDLQKFKDTIKNSEEELLLSNKNYFIIHGIIHNQSKNISRFEEIYTIEFKFENCVIDPFSYKKLLSNNKRIATLLTDKYGDGWRKDLPVIPLGID